MGRRNKVGYHYTTLKNWTKIKKEGLKPYFLKNLDSREATEEGMDYGIWLWKKKAKGKVEFGNVIYHMTTKQTLDIVQLAVEYQEHDRQFPNGRRLDLTHDLTVGDYVYHKKLPSVVITNTIPIERIILIKVYNGLNLIK